MFNVRLFLLHRLEKFLVNSKLRGTDRLWSIIRDPLTPDLHKTVVRVEYGFNIIVDPIVDDCIERQIFYKGKYEAGTLEAFKAILNESDVFIDVGSNIGLMSLSAAKFVGAGGEVHSFEALPSTYSMLEDNLKLNKKIKKVKAHNRGIGSEKGNLRIYEKMEINRGCSTFIEQDDKDGVDVEVTTLDDYCREEGIDTIKLIKIDVEGWELEVLKGAKEILSSENAPILCVEYSKMVDTFGGVSEDIYKYITSINNYKVFKLRKGKGLASNLIEVTSIDELPDHDNLFCFPGNHMNCDELFPKDV